MTITAKEVQFVHKLSEGHKLTEIAKQTGEKYNQIYWLYESLKERTGTENMAHLVGWFFNYGYLTPTEKKCQ